MINKLIALKKVKKHIEAKIAACEQSLLNQHKIEIEETLASKDEPYGDVTIGNVKFKVPKYVKWEQKELINVQNEIIAQGGNPHDWIDYKMSVSETKFKALPDILKNKFDKARKVTSGKINVSIKESQ